MIGTFLGVLFMGLLSNGMTLMGVDPYWQEVARGLILLFAVLISVAEPDQEVGGETGRQGNEAWDGWSAHLTPSLMFRFGGSASWCLRCSVSRSTLFGAPAARLPGCPKPAILPSIRVWPYRHCLARICVYDSCRNEALLRGKMNAPCFSVGRYCCLRSWLRPCAWLWSRGGGPRAAPPPVVTTPTPVPTPTPNPAELRRAWLLHSGGAAPGWLCFSAVGDAKRERGWGRKRGAGDG